MARPQFRMIDTRTLSDTRDCAFDGFVHLVPWKYQAIHIMSIKCWCDPRIVWGDVAIIVSHKDKRPHVKEKPDAT